MQEGDLPTQARSTLQFEMRVVGVGGVGVGVVSSRVMSPPLLWQAQRAEVETLLSDDVAFYRLLVRDFAARYQRAFGEELPPPQPKAKKRRAAAADG